MNSIAPLNLEHTNSLYKIAQVLAHSSIIPEGLKDRRDPNVTAANIFLVGLKGNELGLSTTVALSSIYVVKGRVTCSAELMRGLAWKCGHKVYIQATATEARAEVIRHDDPDRPQYFSFTWDDAKRAGLTDGANWVKYPASMLSARVTSFAMRAALPDVMMGMSHTPEELGAPVQVTDDGLVEVVDAGISSASQAYTIGRAQLSVTKSAGGDVEIAKRVWEEMELPREAGTTFTHSQVFEACARAEAYAAEAAKNTETEETTTDAVVEEETAETVPAADTITLAQAQRRTFEAGDGDVEIAKRVWVELGYHRDEGATFTVDEVEAAEELAKTYAAEKVEPIEGDTGVEVVSMEDDPFAVPGVKAVQEPEAGPPARDYRGEDLRTGYRPEDYA